MARHEEPGYSETDRERFVAEERFGPRRRGEFARDRARVLHSSALRRLGAKTQVLSPSGGDFARTRLTHSLEVAQIGREMATDLGLSADLVDMACLAHDLGHPPFGHNGETALNEWASDFGGFEGNAQTLRLLSRMEPKVVDDQGRSVGLNLTRASLDAACKYPWARTPNISVSGIDRGSKFGVYQDDLPVFDWLRLSAVEGVKCIEAQVMDFADDVAYSVHDFEDAIVSGFIDITELNDPATRSDLIYKIADWNGHLFTAGELEAGLESLSESEYWPSSFAGATADLARLKNLTSYLIGSFVSRTTERVMSANPQETLVRYFAQVDVPRDVQIEISVLKGIVSAFLMSHESRRPFYEWQRALLTELADALLAANGEHLDAFATSAWISSSDDASRHRAIIDQIASLTDQSALNLHNQLVNRSA